MLALQFRHGWEPAAVATLIASVVILCKAARNRKLLVALALSLASPSHAAPIHIGPTPPAVPEDYIEVQIELTTFNFPREYSVRDSATDDSDIDQFVDVPYESVPDRLVEPFWVLKAEPLFDFRQGGFTIHYLEISLADFLAAGDEAVVMLLDPGHSGNDPWNTIEWESPNLGEVQITYEISGDPVPEPRGLIVAAWGAVIGWVGTAGARRP